MHTIPEQLATAPNSRSVLAEYIPASACHHSSTLILHCRLQHNHIRVKHDVCSELLIHRGQGEWVRCHARIATAWVHPFFLQLVVEKFIVGDQHLHQEVLCHDWAGMTCMTKAKQALHLCKRLLCNLRVLPLSAPPLTAIAFVGGGTIQLVTAATAGLQ